MHHRFFSKAHPRFAVHKGEKATSSRFAPTQSARRVHAG